MPPTSPLEKNSIHGPRWRVCNPDDPFILADKQGVFWGAFALRPRQKQCSIFSLKGSAIVDHRFEDGTVYEATPEDFYIARVGTTYGTIIEHVTTLGGDTGNRRRLLEKVTPLKRSGVVNRAQHQIRLAECYITHI